MNQVGGDVDHVQNVIYAFVPSLQEEGFIFDWSEINCVVDSVDSA
jgi:hypothetical protein